MKWVVKTSTVRVSDEGGDRVYRSIEDVPEELRDRIEQSVDGPASQTILIANQEAFDHIQSDSPELPDQLQRIRRALSGEPVAPKNPNVRPPAPQRTTEPDVDWRILLGGGLAAIAALWSLWIWSIRSGMS